MLKKSMLTLLFLISMAQAAPGDLIHVQAAAPLENIKAIRNRACPGTAKMQPAGNVLRFKVWYETTDLDHKPTIATGLVMVPSPHPKPLPLLSYQHGTILLKSLAPSYLSPDSMGVGACFTSLGFVTIVPDYLGLGDSSLTYHPYHHAETEASAAADLLTAVKKSKEKLGGFELNEKLFLTGYSQGGHATMALHKYLEEKGIAVTASAPMSGAYDLVTTFLDLLDSQEPSSTVEVALATFSMEIIYKIFPSKESEFLPAYASQLGELFNGTHNWDEVIPKFPATPREMLQPKFIEIVKANPQHPFTLAVKKNNLFDWKPKAPVKLYYGSADKEVPPKNAKNAAARMNELGGKVELVEIKGTNHATTKAPAFLSVAKWFLSK